MKANYFFLIWSIIMSSTKLSSQDVAHNDIESSSVYNLVWSMVEDNKGTKWFGTSNGVTSYDGVSWKTYNTSNSGIISNSIRTIAIDTQHQIWFGTDHGLSKFDGINWISYTINDGLVDNQINCITKDSNGHLWIGTQGGVTMFDGQLWTNYTIANGLVDNTIRCIAIDKMGYKWFGTQKGISRFRDCSWTTYSNNKSLENGAIESIAIDLKGTIWVGTQGGIYRLEDSSKIDCTFNRYLNIIKSGSKQIDPFEEENLLKFNGTIRTYYTTSNGVATNSLSTIALDFEDITNSQDNSSELTNLSSYSEHAGYKLGDINKIQPFLNIAKDIVYLKTALNKRIITVYNGAGRVLFLKQMNNEAVPSDLEEGYYEISFRNSDGQPKIVNSLNFK